MSRKFETQMKDKKYISTNRKLFFWIKGLNILTMTILSKLALIFNEILVKILRHVLHLATIIYPIYKMPLKTEQKIKLKLAILDNRQNQS